MPVLLAAARSGKHDWKRLRLVLRVEQDADEIQDLLGRAGATREHDDAVADADERLETLLDVREVASWFTIAFGGSAATMPGSVSPM